MLFTKPIFRRLVIIAFMILVGYCMAEAIHLQNTLSVILALISLGAGIYFIHLLGEAKRQMEAEKTEE